MATSVSFLFGCWFIYNNKLLALLKHSNILYHIYLVLSFWLISLLVYYMSSLFLFFPSLLSFLLPLSLFCTIPYTQIHFLSLSLSLSPSLPPSFPTLISLIPPSKSFDRKSHIYIPFLCIFWFLGWT